MNKKINEKVKILQGRSIAHDIVEDLDKKIALLKNKNIHPHLAVILIGDNEASQLYVKLKRKQAEEIGIDFSLYNFAEDIEEKKVIDLIKDLNTDPQINGIVVQLPLPKRLNTQNILDQISSKKDVDGLKCDKFTCPTILAIWQIIQFYDLPKDSILIIGRGKLVGEPLSKYLTKKKIKFSRWGKDQFDEIKLSQFSLIICGTGQKKLIAKHFPLEGSYLIDAGGKDVDFDAMYDCCAGLTPPIGGVGPLTIAYLLENTVKATKEQNR